MWRFRHTLAQGELGMRIEPKQLCALHTFVHEVCDDLLIVVFVLFSTTRAISAVKMRTQFGAVGIFHHCHVGGHI